MHMCNNKTEYERDPTAPALVAGDKANVVAVLLFSNCFAFAAVLLRLRLPLSLRCRIVACLECALLPRWGADFLRKAALGLSNVGLSSGWYSELESSSDAEYVG